MNAARDGSGAGTGVTPAGPGSRPWTGAMALMLVIVLAASCGGVSRGVELGHLRGLAERVEGGGVECPLATSERLLRPSTVARDTPILPLRADGPGANGAIDEGLRAKEGVRITCRYQIGGLGVTTDVVGVAKGHAVAEYADALSERGDEATVLTFIDVNADLPVGRARALPGEPPAAFSRVAAASGDIALVLSVDRLDDDATLPQTKEVTRRAVAIARSLAD